MNLIHYVAIQAEKKNRNLLSFPDSLTVLEDAAKFVHILTIYFSKF